MKKRFSLATTLVLILFAVLLTFQITYHVIETEYQKKVDVLTKTQTDFSLLAYADGLIRENFKGAVDEDSLENGLIKGYVSSLSDPYSRYLNAEEYRQYKEESKKTGFGIGARFTYNATTKEILVYAVYPASPAEEAGLRKGDVLTGVGSQAVADLEFYDAVKAISGEAGTTVRVTVNRRMAAQVFEMSFDITRREMKEPTVSYEFLSEKVGYIQIFDILEDTAEEFSTALEEILRSEVEAVIFDVRNNAGDNMESVSKMLDRLLPEGVLMTVEDNKGNVNEIKSDATYAPVKMAVLMNSSTACAPEIFAATLRDFGAATLVGETTFGKGKIQTIVEMDNGGALILSNAVVTPPASPNVEGVGVIPDVESKLKLSNPYLATHEEDTQLQDAKKTLGIDNKRR